MSDSTVPGGTVPESSVPDSTVPDSTVPDSTVPDSSVPTSTAPASTVPASTAPTGRVFVVGNAIADIRLAVDALPERGGDVLASSTLTSAGGAFNALVACTRDGVRAIHVGPLGTGPFASLVAEALLDAGIERRGATVADVDTGFSVVLVDSEAERTFVTSVGAEARLTAADVAGVEVTDHDVVLVSGYALAHPANASVVPPWLEALPPSTLVVFDPSPLVGSLPADALARVLARADVVSANAREARLWLDRAEDSGQDADGRSDREGRAGAVAGSDAAADATRLALLTGRPGAAVLVRDGAEGCWIAGPGHDAGRSHDAGSAAPSARHVPGYPVDAVDTTGAGDAHCGVFCAGLARGLGLDDAARRATVAAAIAVTRPGPATAPTAVETDALLARL